MKLKFSVAILATALISSALLAAATSALAQSSIGFASQDVSDPSSPASTAGPIASQQSGPISPDFLQGQLDRQRYETWFGGLNGDFGAGATYWAAHRSLANSAPCVGSGSPATNQAWSDGCIAAQQRLAPSDRLRLSSPAYRLGWNHPSAQIAGPSLPPTVSPQSSSPADPPPAAAGAPLGSLAGGPTNADAPTATNDISAEAQSSPTNDAAPPAAPVTQPSPQPALSAGARLALVLVPLLVVLAALVLSQLSWIIPLYNRLVVLRQNANRAFADMDVLLKQRRDLIPNIVETVKGYASHENATLRSVVSLRSVAAGSGDINEKISAEQSLSSALGKLFALAEAYPDLKANTGFIAQQGTLSDVEIRISNIRMGYNKTIGEYNTAIQRFPAIVVAGMLGFHSRGFFNIGAEVRSELNESRSVQSLTQNLTT